MRDLFPGLHRNPSPRAWKDLSPSTPYPCAPRESRYVGAVVPGRGGGQIVACATPAKPPGAPGRREGGFWIGLPTEGFGHAIPKSRARRRIRSQGLEYVTGDPILSAQIAELAATEYPHVPGPVPLEFRHARGSSRCDPEHPIWARYGEALEGAAETAAIVYEGGGGEAEYRGLVLEQMERHPDFETWRKTENACLEGYAHRVAKKTPGATFSTARESARRRQEFLASGGDPTSAEYLDLLTPGARAKALRRLGRLQEARDIEARQRAIKHGVGRR